MTSSSLKRRRLAAWPDHAFLLAVAFPPPEARLDMVMVNCHGHGRTLAALPYVCSYIGHSLLDL